jgi:hypothetical protein
MSGVRRATELAISLKKLLQLRTKISRIGSRPLPTSSMQLSRSK